MNKFDICLTDEIVKDDENPEEVGPFPGAPDVYGKVTIGEHSETFVTCLATWDRKMYEQHWALALRRIMEGASKSALITSYVEPSLADYLVWWPLYRSGTTVYVQNQMLFYDQLARPFSSQSSWESMPERRILTDEGIAISEWVTDLTSIQECANRIESRR